VIQANWPAFIFKWLNIDEAVRVEKAAQRSSLAAHDSANVKNDWLRFTIGHDVFSSTWGIAENRKLVNVAPGVATRTMRHRSIVVISSPATSDVEYQVGVPPSKLLVTPNL
jgi:hypothetical protein